MTFHLSSKKNFFNIRGQIKTWDVQWRVLGSFFVYIPLQVFIFWTMEHVLRSRIWGSHGGEYEDCFKIAAIFMFYEIQ
jgi:hypothetical protein